MTPEELNSAISNIQDLITMLLESEQNIQREIMFYLLTEYKEVFLNNFQKELRANRILREVFEDVRKSIIYCSIISNFNEDGEPEFQTKSFLLKKEDNEKEKLELFQRLEEFNRATIFMYNLKKQDYQTFESLREEYVCTYLIELSKPENGWIISLFSLEGEEFKKERKTNHEIID